ncbi:MAG: hypothetical protein ACXWUG_16620 [Polyangiales bacterium]
MRVAVVIVILASCAHPSPNDLHAKADPVDASPVVSEAAPAPPKEPDQTLTPWMVACTKELDAAVVAAGKHSPAMAGMDVESKIFVDGNGARVEELSLYRLGFYLRVSRRSPPESGDDTWKMRAESLKGSYHRSDLRTGPKGSAFIAFDGVPMPAAVELSPIFRGAIDRCL